MGVLPNKVIRYSRNFRKSKEILLPLISSTPVSIKIVFSLVFTLIPVYKSLKSKTVINTGTDVYHVARYHRALTSQSFDSCRI